MLNHEWTIWVPRGTCGSKVSINSVFSEEEWDRRVMKRLGLVKLHLGPPWGRQVPEAGVGTGSREGSLWEGFAAAGTTLFGELSVDNRDPHRKQMLEVALMIEPEWKKYLN